MENKTPHLPLRKIFISATKDFKTNSVSLRLFWIIGFVFLGLFNLIDGGLSNPLSILWLAGYYLYWCAFFRVYYHKKPYLWSRDLLNSVAPSTKMFFLAIIVCVLIAILPFLPLLMGFNDQYMIFFENYMEAIQHVEVSLLNQAIFGLIILFLSPLLITRPFFAWIASLQGLNGSLRKAFRKTEGNYLNFILVMLILNLPCLIVVQIDKLLDCHDLFSICFLSFFFLYFNLVFAKMYDFFSENK